MAWSSGGQLLNTNTKNSSTTFTLGGVTVASGDSIVVFIVFDNTSTTTPTMTLNKPAAETAEWVQVIDINTNRSASAAGVLGDVWIITTTTSWSSFSLVATFSEAITAKCARVWKFSGGSSTVRGAAVTDWNNASSTLSVTLTGASQPQSGDLILALTAVEGSSNNAGDDSDLTTTGGVFGTSGGSDLTNVVGQGQYHIVTTTGDVTYNPGTEEDWGIGAVVLQPAGGGGTTHTVDQTDTVGITDTATIEQTHNVSQTDPVAITDTADVAQTHNFTQTDTVAITDSATVELLVIHTVDQTDTVSITDSAVVELTAGGVTLTEDPVDTVGIVDAIRLYLECGDGTLQDRVYCTLGDLGYTGTLNDRQFNFIKQEYQDRLGSSPPSYFTMSDMLRAIGFLADELLNLPLTDYMEDF